MPINEHFSSWAQFTYNYNTQSTNSIDSLNDLTYFTRKPTTPTMKQYSAALLLLFTSCGVAVSAHSQIPKGSGNTASSVNAPIFKGRGSKSHKLAANLNQKSSAIPIKASKGIVNVVDISIADPEFEEWAQIELPSESMSMITNDPVREWGGLGMLPSLSLSLSMKSEHEYITMNEEEERITEKAATEGKTENNRGTMTEASIVTSSGSVCAMAVSLTTSLIVVSALML